MIESNELSKNSRGGTELMVEGLVERLDSELLSKFQIIPSRVREIDPDRIPILWLHDLPGDPEAAHLTSAESRERFAGFVLPSNWSLQLYNLQLGLPYSKAKVLKNAITPIPPHHKANDGPIRVIYHTTPHRGLQLLVPVWEHITNQFPDLNIHLDVYSSFSIYGWSERDKPYEDLFERCRNHPKITYHGAVPNEEVRIALFSADIFAYPSIWPETSCIAMIEALSAGCVAVCPNYAALPETCANWAMMYQWSENPQEHCNRFAHTLINAIVGVGNKRETPENTFRNRLAFQKDYIDIFYNWDNRVAEWTQYLNEILKEKGA